MAVAGTGRLVVLAAGALLFGGLVSELRMPQLTIPAGGSASVSFLLAASFASGGDQMDFVTVPAKVCLALPAGVTLEDNSVVPLNSCQ